MGVGCRPFLWAGISGLGSRPSGAGGHPGHPPSARLGLAGAWGRLSPGPSSQADEQEPRVPCVTPCPVSTSVAPVAAAGAISARPLPAWSPRGRMSQAQGDRAERAAGGRGPDPQEASRSGPQPSRGQGFQPLPADGRSGGTWGSGDLPGVRRSRGAPGLGPAGAWGTRDTARVGGWRPGGLLTQRRPLAEPRTPAPHRPRRPSHRRSAPPRTPLGENQGGEESPGGRCRAAAPALRLSFPAGDAAPGRAPLLKAGFLGTVAPTVEGTAEHPGPRATHAGDNRAGRSPALRGRVTVRVRSCPDGSRSAAWGRAGPEVQEAE